MHKISHKATSVVLSFQRAFSIVGRISSPKRWLSWLIVWYSVALNTGVIFAYNYKFEGNLIYSMYDENGKTNFTQVVPFHGIFGGGRYIVSLLANAELEIETAYDLTNNYRIVSSKKASTVIAASTNTSSSTGATKKPSISQALKEANESASPAQISRAYFPYDGDIYTRSIVHVLARCDGKSDMPRAIEHDPWMEPRVQPAFEASQCVISNNIVIYTIDSSKIPALINSPRNSDILSVRTSRSQFQKHSRGYLDSDKIGFTNSQWIVNIANGAGGGTIGARCETARYHTPANKQHFGKIFETISIDFNATEVGSDSSNESVFRPNISSRKISIVDYRQSLRNSWIDSIEYMSNNEGWRSADDPRSKALLGQLAAAAPMRAYDETLPTSLKALYLIFALFAAFSPLTYIYYRRHFHSQKK